ncbi:PH domain-containing protein [Paenibacillus xanthanilyticus]|uniref:PH domain-containing protein n=1 Tax=Paenibacillus xanthanilyticus TaxID=1783531 RepID=A0ABV8JZF2_9BACL
MAEETSWDRLDKRVTQANKMAGAIASAVYAALALALVALTVRFGWPWWIAAVAGALAAAAMLVEIFIAPQLAYRTWRYALHEEEIELHHGLWFRRRTMIPYAKIQHVDAKQGPIMRKYGLFAITFSTAAGSHKIPALAEQTADRVRRHIAVKARIADERL